MHMTSTACNYFLGTIEKIFSAALRVEAAKGATNVRQSNGKRGNKNSRAQGFRFKDLGQDRFDPWTEKKKQG